MRLRLCMLTVLSTLAWVSAASAQGAADRASTRTDTTRAKAEGRFDRPVEYDQQETIVREEVVTVPVKPRARPATAALLPIQDGEPKTKRIVIRRVETVKKLAPLKINPF